ncbi:hypothetical protein [Aurantimonas sp. VKM B-3413]|uniref:hypothetical protein n=1 Tax=Aurantimonas sp. VKM B-3413 TaxID=2779401 RepID=UPI001E2CCD45|nr:hypothetical protein [Aurantimonas sp. VKM B-3413]MCB8840202.1 hypothetical protein [Aurantimonas sp. VKM B-3413]
MPSFLHGPLQIQYEFLEQNKGGDVAISNLAALPDPKIGVSKRPPVAPIAVLAGNMPVQEFCTEYSLDGDRINLEGRMNSDRSRKLQDLSVSDLIVVLLVIDLSDEVGSFESASERLHIKKTTLSSRIARVEEIFGPIFFRGPGGRRLPTPTSKGTVFYGYAKKILKNLEKLVDILNDMDHVVSEEELEFVRMNIKKLRGAERDALLWDRINTIMSKLPPDTRNKLDRKNLMGFVQEIPRRDPLSKHEFQPVIDHSLGWKPSKSGTGRSKSDALSSQVQAAGAAKTQSRP